MGNKSKEGLGVSYVLCPADGHRCRRTTCIDHPEKDRPCNVVARKLLKAGKHVGNANVTIGALDSQLNTIEDLAECVNITDAVEEFGERLGIDPESFVYFVLSKFKTKKEKKKKRKR